MRAFLRMLPPFFVAALLMALSWPVGLLATVLAVAWVLVVAPARQRERHRRAWHRRFPHE